MHFYSMNNLKQRSAIWLQKKELVAGDDIEEQLDFLRILLLRSWLGCIGRWRAIGILRFHGREQQHFLHRENERKGIRLCIQNTRWLLNSP